MVSGDISTSVVSKWPRKKKGLGSIMTNRVYRVLQEAEAGRMVEEDEAIFDTRTLGTEREAHSD